MKHAPARPQGPDASLLGVPWDVVAWGNTGMSRQGTARVGGMKAGLQGPFQRQYPALLPHFSALNLFRQTASSSLCGGRGP